MAPPPSTAWPLDPRHPSAEVPSESTPAGAKKKGPASPARAWLLCLLFAAVSVSILLEGNLAGLVSHSPSRSHSLPCWPRRRHLLDASCLILGRSGVHHGASGDPQREHEAPLGNPHSPLPSEVGDPGAPRKASLLEEPRDLRQPDGGVPSRQDCDTLREWLSVPTGIRRNASDQGPQLPFRRDGECWSAREWHCFSGGSPPSPALMSAIAKYKQRWRQCHAIESPEQVLHSLAAGISTACRYTLWSPMEMGLGNLMLSLVSSFLYSLLTSRILLIEPSSAVGGTTPGGFSSLFCQPFPDTPSWLLSHVMLLGGEVARSEWGGYSFRLNQPVNVSGSLPPVLVFHVHHLVDLAPVFCEGFHSWAWNASAVVTSGNMYWVPALYHVPMFRRSLDVLFPQREVFATLAPLVLHPANHIWEEVTRTLASIPPPNALREGQRPLPRVAIHFRKGFGIHPGEALDAAARCLEGIGERHLQAEGGGNRTAGGLRMQVMVASLSPEFRDFFEDQMRMRDVQVQSISLTRDSFQQSADSLHNERALREMLLLALFPDVSLATPRSTFGYAFQGLSPGRPLFLSSPCEDARHEPCMLIPPQRADCSMLTLPPQGTSSYNFFASAPRREQGSDTSLPIPGLGSPGEGHTGAGQGARGEDPPTETCPDTVWSRASFATRRIAVLGPGGAPWRSSEALGIVLRGRDSLSGDVA